MIPDFKEDFVRGVKPTAPSEFVGKGKNVAKGLSIVTIFGNILFILTIIAIFGIYGYKFLHFKCKGKTI